MSRRDIDRIIDSGLQRPAGAPDLTRSIMGRLGYMQVSPAVARRRRLQRWLRRASLVCVAGVAGWLGVLTFLSSPESRQPADFTMPSAVNNDFQNQQHRMNSVIQLLRELPPVIEQNEADEADVLYLDEDVDRSAVAPVRWV